MHLRNELLSAQNELDPLRLEALRGKASSWLQSQIWNLELRDALRRTGHRLMTRQDHFNKLSLLSSYNAIGEFYTALTGKRLGACSLHSVCKVYKVNGKISLLTHCPRQ
jgi:hypothetical protein